MQDVSPIYHFPRFSRELCRALFILNLPKWFSAPSTASFSYSYIDFAMSKKKNIFSSLKYSAERPIKKSDVWKHIHENTRAFHTCLSLSFHSTLFLYTDWILHNGDTQWSRLSSIWGVCLLSFPIMPLCRAWIWAQDGEMIFYYVNSLPRKFCLALPNLLQFSFGKNTHAHMHPSQTQTWPKAAAVPFNKPKII